MTDKKTYTGRLDFIGVTHKEDEAKTISKSKIGKPSGVGLILLGIEGGTLYFNAQRVGYINMQTGDYAVGKNGRILTGVKVTIEPEYADENPEIVAHIESLKAVKKVKDKK